MKNFIVVIAFATLLASCEETISSTVTPQHEVIIWGAGNSSCGEYLRLADKHKANESGYAQWLDGYITGLNASNPQIDDHAARVDRYGKMTWIADYCKQNPFDKFALAAQRLVDELKSKQRQRPASEL